MQQQQRRMVHSAMSHAAASALQRPAAAPYFGGGYQTVLLGTSPDRPLPPPDAPAEPPKGGLGGFFFWVRLLFVLGWAGVLLAGFFYKLTQDTLADVAQHLTNWAWNVNALFYTLDLLSHLDPTGRMAVINVSALFWMCHGLSWAVFWLMFVVLQVRSRAQCLACFFTCSLVSVG